MNKYLVVAVTIIALLANFAGGCLNSTGEESTGIETGIVKLNLADAPIDSGTVEDVHITINAIQYDLNGEWITAEGFEYPQSYNLLGLTGGNFAKLGEFGLPAGYYVQIRFILDITEFGTTPAEPGCYIKFADSSEKKPLYVPSGGETGFKAIGAFEVPANGTVEVTADFNVQEAIVEAGQNGAYILKPTIRLIQNDQTGNISGSITGDSIYENIRVYAYEDGMWTGEEAKAQIGNNNPFPKSVARAEVDGDGNYNLALLAAATYDLVVVEFEGDELVEVMGFVSDVQVKKQQTAINDIDLPLPEAPVELVALEGNKGILLEWANNTEADLDGYNVYFSTTSGGPYIKIAQVKVSRYNDNGLINGITYYYVVTAFDDSNNESLYSNQVSALPSS